MTLAVMVAHAAARPSDGADTAVLTSTIHPNLAIPDGRAILLGLGILAIAYTYQRIWLNWRRGVAG
ncbi:MAG: hypothetical protein U0984_07675 [Prosthecobacter sp.]|nr:hypothetical protein [Prosthecobacter sp.]